MNYETTKKYINRLDKEVSNGIYAVDGEMKKYFQTIKTKDKIKGTMLEDNSEFIKHETEYDMRKESIDNINNMRFIYMMTLLESFLKEYSQERDMNLRDATIVSNWDNSGKLMATNESPSLLNTEYIEFFLKESVSVDIKINPLGKELGLLRNCIAHRNGIMNGFDVTVLENTLTKLKQEKKAGNRVILDNFTIKDILGIIKGIMLECHNG